MLTLIALYLGMTLIYHMVLPIGEVKVPTLNNGSPTMYMRVGSGKPSATAREERRETPTRFRVLDAGTNPFLLHRKKT